MRELLRPSRLAPGARVAVVAPSGPVPEERVQAGLDVLRGWDLDPVVAPHVLDRHGEFDYLAGTDADRAADLQAAWCDPSVDAVLCARGGYGVQRMVELLDWDAMSAAGPKVFVGFSDITALHEPLNARGLVTLHGPMAAAVEQLDTAGGLERLRALLFEPSTVTDLLAPVGARTVVGGVAEGVLRGGNLAMLASSVGTPTYAPPAGVVVLEDVDEAGYRVDRLLTQLLRAGWFDEVTGVVVGDFTGTQDSVEVIAERLEPLGVPMVAGAAIGHEALNLAVPLGLPVRLDATAGVLTPGGPAGS